MENKVGWLPGSWALGSLRVARAFSVSNQSTQLLLPAKREGTVTPRSYTVKTRLQEAYSSCAKPLLNCTRVRKTTARGTMLAIEWSI
ncbi:hypothetical protein VTL71DRAFT_2320, partial [Oculimacula yallundae]